MWKSIAEKIGILLFLAGAFIMYILFLNGMIFGNEHGEGAIIPLLELAKKIPADGVMKVAPFFLHVIIPVGWFSFYLIQELKGEDSSTIFISFAALLVGLLAIHFLPQGNTRKEFS